jgi:hypothetical protein
MFYYIWYRKIVIFNQLGVPLNFFKDLRGATNQKRLQNTALNREVLKKICNFFSILTLVFNFTKILRAAFPAMLLRPKKY